MLEEENGRKKTTVEDLLRIKRSEVPSDEFWNGFNRQLEKRIVQSVVRGRTFPQLVGDWLLTHGRIVSVSGFVLLGAALYFSGTSADDSGSGVSIQSPARIAPVAESITLPNRIAKTVSAAPSLAVANHDFVIEVLSSAGSADRGSNVVWTGDSEKSDQGAYYVADQLSSRDHGWSGERLPF